MEDTPQNPYLQEELSVAPFAGRQQVFSRLHQHIIDPAKTHAMLILGRQGIGKSALLQQFDAVFDDNLIGVYLPLRELPLTSETAWLEALIEANSTALDQHGFSLNRLETRTEFEDDVREWLAQTRLPDILAAIRPQRRLIWLMDDAEKLIDALRTGQLPADTLAYLQSLLHEYPQLGIVLTIDATHESELDKLSPLVNTVEVIRLANLDAEESTQLLEKPVMGMYSLPEASVMLVQQATGGQPRLLQELSFHLFEHWRHNSDEANIEPEVVKQIINRVFVAREADFKQVWQESTRDERLILTAMSSLLYANPVQKISTANIEGWLVKTDYPMDKTAINSAIRGLEYREIIGQAKGGMVINSGLLQRWLMANAQLTPTQEAGMGTRPRRRYSLLVGIGVALVILLIFALILSTPPVEVVQNVEPTVTLSQSE